jgi:hypothetical protein
LIAPILLSTCLHVTASTRPSMIQLPSLIHIPSSTMSLNEVAVLRGLQLCNYSASESLYPLLRFIFSTDFSQVGALAFTTWDMCITIEEEVRSIVRCFVKAIHSQPSKGSTDLEVRDSSRGSVCYGSNISLIHRRPWTHLKSVYLFLRYFSFSAQLQVLPSSHSVDC